MRVLDRVTDTGLGGQVHDTTEVMFAKHVHNRLGVREIRFDGSEVVEIKQLSKPVTFQLNVVVVIDDVDTDDVDPLL